MQALVDTLLKQFPEAVLSVDLDRARSELTIHVAAPKIVEVARYLHRTEAVGRAAAPGLAASDWRLVQSAKVVRRPGLGRTIGMCALTR